VSNIIVNIIGSLTQVMNAIDKFSQYKFKEINKSLNIQSVLLWPEHMHGEICATHQWLYQ